MEHPVVRISYQWNKQQTCLINSNNVTTDNTAEPLTWNKSTRSPSRWGVWYCYCVVLRWCEAMSMWNGASNGPFVHPPHIWVNMEQQRWNDIDRGKPNDSEKKLSPCHFVHHKGLPWARTRASAVSSRRLTPWPMARPRRGVRPFSHWGDATAIRSRKKSSAL
jgi:hypothetical protein